MSKFCKTCGAELETEQDVFCSACGANQDEPVNVNPANAQQQGIPYVQPMVQPMMMPVIEQETTILGWFGWTLLCYFLPLIGQIIVLCTARNKTLKNWAAAQLIVVGLIVIPCVIIAAILVAGSLASS